MAKITIFEMESYLRHENHSLFENVVFPESVEREALIDNIMLNAGEFESLYSNPYFMQTAVESWGKKYARTFEKWANVISQTYNPLDNYDRTETTNDHIIGSGTSGASGTDIEKVSAFDTNTFQNRGQTTTASEASGTSETTSTHDSRIHGNIGVMSTQALLLEEVGAAKQSVINLITDLFKTEFCVMIY